MEPRCLTLSSPTFKKVELPTIKQLNNFVVQLLLDSSQSSLARIQCWVHAFDSIQPSASALALCNFEDDAKIFPSTCALINSIEAEAAKDETSVSVQSYINKTCLTRTPGNGSFLQLQVPLLFCRCEAWLTNAWWEDYGRTSDGWWAIDGYQICKSCTASW